MSPQVEDDENENFHPMFGFRLEKPRLVEAESFLCIGRYQNSSLETVTYFTHYCKHQINVAENLYMKDLSVLQFFVRSLRVYARIVGVQEWGICM